MRKLFAIMIVLAMPFVLRAQNNHADWNNLSVLQAGQKIQVTDASHKKHSGTFSSFSDQSIVFHESNGEQTIPRASVLRVNASGGHHVRHALIGMAIGAGAGAGIGAAGGGCSSGNCIGISRGGVAGIGAVVGALIGAIIGGVIPSHKTIYRAAP
ncbi:MAG: hypothetical protein ACREDA_13505 [Methylocella sp.]